MIDWTGLSTSVSMGFHALREIDLRRLAGLTGSFGQAALIHAMVLRQAHDNSGFGSTNCCVYTETQQRTVLHPARAIDWGRISLQFHEIVTIHRAMTISHYIAETDESHQISAVWVKPAGRKSVRVFNPSVDPLNPNKAAKFDGATEADIRKWIAVQKALAAP